LSSGTVSQRQGQCHNVRDSVTVSQRQGQCHSVTTSGTVSQCHNVRGSATVSRQGQCHSFTSEAVSQCHVRGSVSTSGAVPQFHVRSSVTVSRQRQCHNIRDSVTTSGTVSQHHGQCHSITMSGAVPQCHVRGSFSTSGAVSQHQGQCHNIRDSVITSGTMSQYHNSTEFNCNSISLCKIPLQIISIYLQLHDEIHSRYCTYTVEIWIKTWDEEYIRRCFGFFLFSKLIIALTKVIGLFYEPP
jgi:hypothetical protein